MNNVEGIKKKRVGNTFWAIFSQMIEAHEAHKAITCKRKGYKIMINRKNDSLSSEGEV